MDLSDRGAARLRPSKTSLSDDLTEAIIDLIRREKLAPGDRLPAVQSLARYFGVATPTLREALRRLQATGLVSIRHGAGTYVTSTADRRIVANPHTTVPDAQTVRELLETRLLLEPTAAKLAAVAASNSDSSPAAEVLAVAASQLDDEWALTTTNIRFHVAIAQLSGNKILAETIDALMTTYSKEQQDILALYEDRKRDYEDHRTILETVTSGDAEAAYQRMSRHLNGVINTVEQRILASAHRSI